MIHHISRKWMVLAIVTLVSFITNLDATIVVIGLPIMVHDLELTMLTGLWIITSYIITSTIFLLPAGRWADIIGAKRIFIFGFGIFTIATILCGISTSGTTLIMARFLQGIGAAFSLSTATPIIVRTFPDNQLGLAIGINSTAWVIGSIAGPVIGGALIKDFGWQSIFFVTIPFSVLGMIGGWLVLESKEVLKKARTDWWGILAFGAGLITLLLALSEGPSSGWLSPFIITLFLTTLLMWSAFIVIEMHTQEPLFKLNILTNIHYAAGLGITVNYCIGYFAILFLLTLYLQGALQLTPLQSGILMIPLSAPQLIASPFGGMLADRFGSTRMMLIGISFVTFGIFLLSQLGPQLSVSSVVIPLLIISAAGGVAWPALAKTVFSSTPKADAGSASGMFYTVYNIGRALSQTLALVAMEFSVSSDIISQILQGTSKGQSHAQQNSLVYAVDNSFVFFLIFFVLALFLTLFLIRPQNNTK